jgi:hypothetical protein
VPVAETPGSRGLYGFDARVAHPARVYDYWLGGKDNFEADRIAGEETIAAYPDPGVVKVTEWRPESAVEAEGPTSLWAGVARKP